MKLINSENKQISHFSQRSKPVCNNHQGLCLYLLIGLNVYLGLLVEMDDVTSISTILLVDVNVESFPPYNYVPTPWAKHTKTTVRGSPILKNLSCSKLDFFSPPRVTAGQLRRLLGEPLLLLSSFDQRW
jgi:hypothetical protein